MAAHREWSSIIMAILSISTQGEVAHERRLEFGASGAVPRLADEPAALVIIIRVSRSHLERFGEVEFLNEFVLTSQKAAFVTEFEARAFGVVNFDLDSEVPLVRRACRLMYVSVHSGRQAAGPAMRSVCVHEDKGLRGHRVPDLLTTTITIGLTNPLVALRVKLTLSSQSDSRHSVSPP